MKNNFFMGMGLIILKLVMLNIKDNLLMGKLMVSGN